MLHIIRKCALYCGTGLALLLVSVTVLTCAATPSRYANGVFTLRSTEVRFVCEDSRCGIYIGSPGYGDIDFSSCASMVWNNSDYYIYDVVATSNQHFNFILIGWSLPAIFLFSAPFLIYWTAACYGKCSAKSRVKAGHCTNCGYDLRASPGDCPECGATQKMPANTAVS